MNADLVGTPAAAGGRSGGSSARRTLAVMLAVAAVGALGAAAAPMTPGAPVLLNALLGCAGVLLTAVVLRCRRAAALHVGALALLGGVTAIIAAAATAAGAVATAISYVWVPLYASFFFSRAVARTYMCGVALGLGAALLSNPFPGATHVWVLIVLTSASAAEVVGRLVATLRIQATTDPLTGLLNREGLRQAVDRLSRATGSRGSELTLVVIDLDDFKIVNDVHGHDAGDRLLVRLTSGWRRSLRRHDVAARVGGDEFVLLLPATDAAGAELLLGRLRLEAPDLHWSAGVAAFPRGAQLSQVLREADAHLYAVKRARSRPVAVPAPRAAGTSAARHI